MSHRSALEEVIHDGQTDPPLFPPVAFGAVGSLQDDVWSNEGMEGERQAVASDFLNCKGLFEGGNINLSVATGGEVIETIARTRAQTERQDQHQEK